MFHWDAKLLKSLIRKEKCISKLRLKSLSKLILLILLMNIWYLYFVVLNKGPYSDTFADPEPHIIQVQDNPLVTLRDRAQRMKQTCSMKQSNHTDKKINEEIFMRKSISFTKSKDMYFFPEYKIIWCPVPKVASTSIADKFLELSKATKKQKSEVAFPHVLLHIIYKNPPEIEVDNYWKNFTSFFIVRHPFDRLVSAYKNKLENKSVHDGPYFQSTYGKKIVKKYRTKEDQEQAGTSSGDEPTFKEFVTYLLDIETLNFDLHWRPIWLICDVCHLKYDFFIKFENFSKEFNVLLTHLKRNKQLPETFNIEFLNKQSHTNDKSIDIAKKYMKLLPKSVVEKLYEIYKLDFLLFDYNADNFFNL